MHRYAIQTITWGDPQHQLLPAIAATAKAAGFAGLEVGLRRLSQVDPDRYSDIFAANGLVLAASHVGGNLLDPDQANGEHRQIDVALALVRRLGGSLLLYSGCRDVDDEAKLRAEIATLGELSRICADAGIPLCYHNHDWECRDDLRVLRQIREQVGPTLRFAPDVGWVAKAGCDLAAFMQEFGESVAAIHFKDFASLSTRGDADTVHLGAGAVPFTPVIDWVQQHGSPLWLIAEQDFAPDADVAAHVNGAWLHQQFKNLEVQA